MDQYAVFRDGSSWFSMALATLFDPEEMHPRIGFYDEIFFKIK